MPVTNPHDSGLSYICEACNPPVPMYASTQRALDKLIADHNAEFHPA